MPPKKEVCQHFLRGRCHYGARCKYLHASPQPSKPKNTFAFGMQTGNQIQHTNSEQQKPNPFGFGVQNSFHANGFGSKQIQFKPFENKWNRSSSTNSDTSPAQRQSSNQPLARSHQCTDPESCKRQIREDLSHERPLWGLTCYGHSQNGRCNIVGDTSYEELRFAAYSDAKNGLGLQSIVEKERNLLNLKLLEFERLLQNPDTARSNSSLASPIQTSNSALTSQNSGPPSVSSFSQLGASFKSTGFGTNSVSSAPVPTPNTAFISQKGGPTSVSSFGQLGASFINTGFGANSTPLPNYSFGQPDLSQSLTPGSSDRMTNLPFGKSGSLDSHLPAQKVGVSPAPSALSFGKKGTTESMQIPSLFGNQTAILADGPKLDFHATGHPNVNPSSINSLPVKNGAIDDSIWSKEWKCGEIPEEAPPDQYVK